MLLCPWSFRSLFHCAICLWFSFFLVSYVSISPTDHRDAFSELDTAGLDNTLDSSSSSISNNSNNKTDPNQSLNRSSSNPDLSPSSTSNKSVSSSTTPSIVNGPLHDEEDSAFVVKVYRSDQSYKYFPVHKVRLTRPAMADVQRGTPFRKRPPNKWWC